MPLLHTHTNNELKNLIRIDSHFASIRDMHCSFRNPDSLLRSWLIHPFPSTVRSRRNPLLRSGSRGAVDIVLAASDHDVVVVEFGDNRAEAVVDLTSSYILFPVAARATIAQRLHKPCKQSRERQAHCQGQRGAQALLD